MEDTTRFWSKVHISNGCWTWTAWSNGVGYGLIKVGGKAVLAHRLSYILAKGEIKPGFVIDHLCNNPSCVRPEHLEAKTQRENILRSSKFIAYRKRLLKECKHGHELFGPNLYLRKDGKRACKTCKNESVKRCRTASLYDTKKLR